MTFDDPTLTHSLSSHDAQEGAAGLSLVLAWSADEPARVGERWLMVLRRPHLIGRGPERPDDPAPRAMPVQLRPGEARPTGPLRSRRLSRHQLRVTPQGSDLHVENVGRGALRHNGGPPVSAVCLRAGDVLEIVGKMVLLVEPGPEIDAAAQRPDASHPFGAPDAYGIVGESPVAWELRRQLRFVGPRRAHALLMGESGVGKELAARALHALSERRGGPLVCRNAATLPEGLIDAELFGHPANYPNPGMVDRPGLIGAADGGTLFLDEFAELPPSAQAHLLRVLDGGEYQRLGESRTRRSDFRLLAATNRGLDALKHDVLARFALRVSVPGLNERRADIPLLIQHILRQRLAGDPGLAERFGAEGPRLSTELVTALLRHRYTAHVRELSQLLWQSMLESDGRVLTAPSSMATDDGWSAWAGLPPQEIPSEAIQACLDAHNGNQEQTWQALELSSRHVLARLIRKHNLTVSRSL